MELDPRQKTGLMIIGISLMVILGILTMIRKDEDTPQDKEANVYHDIQSPTSQDVSTSKSHSYINGSEERSQTEDYWDQCSRQKEERDREREEGGAGGGGSVTSEELFGTGDPQPQQRSYQNPYRETPQEREERHRRRQEEAIEMAERMQGKKQEDTSSTAAPPEEPEEEPETPRTEVRRTSVISSLEEGTQIGSLGSNDTVFTDDGTKPFPCMFSKAVKLKSGDRVSVILLEDIVVAGTLVPRNTHLMATCKLSGRLEMEIGSLEMGGRILAFGYEAYDIDGSKGIYCPDVGNESQTVRSRGTSLIGSTLTSRMGRVAGDIVSTGVSLMQGRNGEISISVPAGYTFYIMKKKEQ